MRTRDHGTRTWLCLISIKKLLVVARSQFMKRQASCSSYVVSVLKFQAVCALASPNPVNAVCGGHGEAAKSKEVHPLRQGSNVKISGDVSRYTLCITCDVTCDANRVKCTRCQNVKERDEFDEVMLEIWTKDRNLSTRVECKTCAANRYCTPLLCVRCQTIKERDDFD